MAIPSLKKKDCHFLLFFTLVTFPCLNENVILSDTQRKSPTKNTVAFCDKCQHDGTIVLFLQNGILEDLMGRVVEVMENIWANIECQYIVRRHAAEAKQKLTHVKY